MDLQFDSICLPDPLIVHLSSNDLRMICRCLLSALEVTKMLTLVGESHHEAETRQTQRLHRFSERRKYEIELKANSKTESEITESI